MYQGGVHIPGIERRDCKNNSLIHDNGIALRMAFARSIADNAEIKLLIRFISGNRAGNHVGTAAFTLQIHVINAQGTLNTVCHQPFTHNQAGIFFQLRFCSTFRGVNTLDLHHFHLHDAAVFHVYFRYRIEDSFAPAVAGTIMFFHVFYMRIFADIKAVNTVVFGILHATVINTAAGNYYNVAALSNIKVIINGFLQTALGKNDRNMHTLMHRTGFDADINTAAVFLGCDIYVCSCISPGETSVCTEIIGACRHFMQIGNFADQPFLDFIKLYHNITPSSACCRHPAQKPCQSAGDRFLRASPAVQSAHRKAPQFHRRFSGCVPDGK